MRGLCVVAVALGAAAVSPMLAHAQDGAGSVGVVEDACSHMPAMPTIVADYFARAHRLRAAGQAPPTPSAEGMAIYNDWRRELLVADYPGLCRYRAANRELPPATDRRIVFIGDSITEASSSFGSYRYYLWLELTREGFTVDFVGSMTGTGGEASVPAEFDSDHEGHPGWRADEVAANIERWARSTQPDLVLVHLGTNDLAQGQPPSDVIQDLTTIVDRLRVVNSHIHILLAQIIPMRADGPPDVLELNQAISALAAATSTVASPVASVDHFTGFDQARMTWDGIHPNREGNRKLAANWHTALLPHLRAIQQTTR